MTPGSTKETIDSFSQDDIVQLIQELRNGTFRFRPARRIYIDKPGKKEKRPLGIASPRDRIVQEAMRMILEAIYEPTFSETSHGFRPRRSCHTALKAAQARMQGMNWVIEGDIKGAYDNINHRILIAIISEKIDDRRFIELIRQALKAGYMEFNTKLVKPDIGTPQGSIISPILANIYFDKLDKWMDQLQQSYIAKNQGKEQITRAYNDVRNAQHKASRELEACHDPKERKVILKKLKTIRCQFTNIPRTEAKSKRLRLSYVRYADDWIVAINGPKTDAMEIKEKIQEFLKSELGLELNLDKTKITSIKTKTALFLGYELKIATSIKKTKVTKKGTKHKFQLRRTTGSLLKLLAPRERILKKLQGKGICNASFNPTHCPGWSHLEDVEILRAYKSLQTGLLNYYSIADYPSVFHRINYVLKYSCAKTLACKHKTSIRKVMKKYGNPLRAKYSYKTAKGELKEKTITLANFKVKDLRERGTRILASAKVNLENYQRDPYRHIISRRTRSKLGITECVICGATGGTEMHHIRALKKANNHGTLIQILGAVNRKQIPVCKQCHNSIHKGTYDGLRLVDLANPDQWL